MPSSLGTGMSEAAAPSFGAGFDPSQFGGGLGSFLGGLFGYGASPYSKAMHEYKKWAREGAGYQQPFYQAGTGALGDYQKWLAGMQDPSAFINQLTGQYQESPWAKYQTEQAMRGARNIGSASGLMGSTPLTKFAEQQAQGIASEDMQNWLKNVLGINTQYGAGQFGLAGLGAGAANQLTNLYGQLGSQMGPAAYGREAGRLQDYARILSGLGQMGISLGML